jgi:hypothetical protein
VSGLRHHRVLMVMASNSAFGHADSLAAWRNVSVPACLKRPLPSLPNHTT